MTKDSSKHFKRELEDQIFGLIRSWACPLCCFKVERMMRFTQKITIIVIREKRHCVLIFPAMGDAKCFKSSPSLITLLEKVGFINR